MMLAEAVAEQDRGWGGPAAILIALAAFYAFTQYREWWQARKIQKPSPPPPRGRVHGEDPQVGDGVTTDDTTAESGDDTMPWWRMGVERIELANGSTLVRKAQAVWRTGSSELPEDEPPVEDDEIVIGFEVYGPGTEGLDEVGGESRADYVDRLLEVGVRYTDAVAAIMRDYEVSESTAKRDIAEARGRLLLP